MKRKRIAFHPVKVEETTEDILETCGLSKDYIEKVKIEDKRREEKRMEFFGAKLANADPSQEHQRPEVSKRASRPLLTKRWDIDKMRSTTGSEPPPLGEE